MALVRRLRVVGFRRHRVRLSVVSLGGDVPELTGRYLDYREVLFFLLFFYSSRIMPLLAIHSRIGKYHFCR